MRARLALMALSVAFAASARAADAPPALAAEPQAQEGTSIEKRLRNLVREVEELKEQIRRIGPHHYWNVPPIPGAQSRVIVRHRNDMGRAFRLVKAEFAVDGQPIRGPTRDGLPSIEEPIFDGHLVFGTHRLTATLTYEGNGFGVFGYLKGYRFKVRASELFQVRGKPVEVTVVGYERGDALTQFADRPAVRFDVAE